MGLPVEVDAELAEITIVRWEGLTRQEVDEHYPGERARRMRGKDRLSHRYAGGESLTEILERARSMTGRLDERTTLIVAHAGINRVLVAVLAGLEAQLNDMCQPHDVIYRIGRAATPVVTHLRDAAEHAGPVRCRLELKGQRSRGASDRGCRFSPSCMHEQGKFETLRAELAHRRTLDVLCLTLHRRLGNSIVD